VADLHAKTAAYCDDRTEIFAAVRGLVDKVVIYPGGDAREMELHPTRGASGAGK
jgi:hypothetical protein